jgi:hypothetical protein
MDRFQTPRLGKGTLTAAIACALTISGSTATGQASSSAEQILEDFTKGEADGFPAGWEASRSEALTRQAYVVAREGADSFLRVKGVGSSARIFKRVTWDPKSYPIVTWRWRLRGSTSGIDPLAAVFISLDQDFLGIPVNTKYIWSPNLAKGAIIPGGLFRPAQVVLRTGAEKQGEWLDERVNAYEDFKRIHNHEPAAQAWGISLVASEGVEIDFARIAVARQ